MNKITPIRAFKDNYIWAIHSVKRSEIVVVDPGDASVVLNFLKENQLSLNAVLITHHHWDHTNGLSTLAKHSPHIPIYGPSTIPGITHPVSNGTPVYLAPQQLHLDVLLIPGHTLDHIAYYGNDLLFCGDTLFSAGCGRIFEGTSLQMFQSLKKLVNLPDTTRIYCGHEYTLNNLKFAQMLEPSNPHLAEHTIKMTQRLQLDQPSLPSTIGLEKIINPFCRCENTQFRKIIEAKLQCSALTPLECFTLIRKMKDTF